MFHRRCTRMILALLTLAPLLPLLFAPSVAQDATPPSIATPDPVAQVALLNIAEPPAELPGNGDAAIELRAWEDHYGQALEDVEGAWVLTGSPEFPLATIIVFASEANAQAGIADYQGNSSQFSIRGLDAWTVADRGKWICITASGPMVVIGQALPANVDEPEQDVEIRSCDVLEATLAWLSNVLGAPVATPRASPSSDPAG